MHIINCDIMKNRYIDIGIIIGSFFIFIECLRYREIVFDTVSFSLNIWVNSLIPSIFPFFVLSDILITYHITNYIPKWIKNAFSYIFGVNNNVVSIFFLTIFSGFPAGARMIRMMYDKEIINLKDVEQALIFTHFSNPLFVVSTVGGCFLKSIKLGYIVLISHYLGNIILGIIFRGNYDKSNNDYTEDNVKCQSFGEVLINAIKSSVDILLLILGIISFFLIISSLIINVINLNSYNEVLFRGILEFTMGIRYLSYLDISHIYKAVISTMFISFGGFSVYMQVMSQFIDISISRLKYFSVRVLHSIISGIICFILCIL